MKAVILRCKPNAQFHFGKVALDSNMALANTSNYIHSDTLFSGLMNACAVLYPNQVQSFIDAFQRNIFKISSAYYCLEFNGTIHYFVPKPTLPPSSSSKANDCCKTTIATTEMTLKEVKKIAYVALSILENAILANDWGDKKVCLVSQDGKFLLYSGDISSNNNIAFYRELSTTKVNAHTISKEDTLYYQTNIQIADNPPIDNIKPLVHFYFLVDIKDDADATLKSIFEQCIVYLSKVGIGGERSTGAGQFDGVETKDFIYNVSQSTHYFTMGLFNPSKDELDKTHSYQVLTRGGRFVFNDTATDSDIRTKYVKMIQEGAVLSSLVEGRIVNVTPDKSPTPYFRYGKPILLPLPTKFIQP